jgi:polyvinyl alcohol dehydrogenase (cytochrome)
MNGTAQSQGWLRSLAGAATVAAMLLFGGALLAQSSVSQSQHDREVAELLDKHSDLTDQAKALGSAAYTRVCAACHDTGADRAPPSSALANLSPAAILRIVTDGPMKEQASSLSVEEKAAVAEYLTGRMLGAQTAVKPLMCPANGNWFDVSQPPAFDGWGLDTSNAHSIPASIAGLAPAALGKLKLKWALAFPDTLYSRSQPAMAGGALFVGGDDGTVYALDPASGCAHWTFNAAGAVRSGVVVGRWKAGDTVAAPLVFFGDVLGHEYALDARTGKRVWSRSVDTHPNATLTAAPALHDGVLYVPVSSLEEPAAAVPTHECCTFRGSVAALDARTGAEKWRAWMVGVPKPQTKNAKGVMRYGPSGVAIWSTPLIDAKRGLVYVVTGDNYSDPTTPLSDAIVALDIKTGAVRWHYQATKNDAWNVSCGYGDSINCPGKGGPDFDFGSAPIMARGSDGRDYILAGQKSGLLYALDPATGKLRWQKRVGRGGVFGGIHFGIAAEGGKVFVPVTDIADGGTYTLPARPGVYALDVATGKEVWSAPAGDTCGGKPFCHPGYGAAISVTPAYVLAGSMDGHLRAFDTATGKVLWDTDTDVPVTAVNGAKAHGGSMAGGAAPLAYDGMLIVNSGYGGLGKMPGNVLLVYASK